MTGLEDGSRENLLKFRGDAGGWGGGTVYLHKLSPLTLVM